MLPPTKSALLQHIYRAAYQSGVIWGQALENHLQQQSPDSWGWIKKMTKVPGASTGQTNNQFQICVKSFVNVLVNSPVVDVAVVKNQI